jgi:hypothetical protein
VNLLVDQDKFTLAQRLVLMYQLKTDNNKITLFKRLP